MIWHCRFERSQRYQMQFKIKSLKDKLMRWSENCNGAAKVMA